MKIAFAMVLALFLIGCSGNGSDETQDSEPQQMVGEMPADAQTQNNEEAEAPVAEETDISDEADSDETTTEEIPQPQE
ncbi:MAG: hypothetical protein MUP09_01895 [Thiovulaceae bacterium]|nr:hypothetical protein [Sulfurimonadaceae bacterium]